jgi:hypothetical protein
MLSSFKMQAFGVWAMMIILKKSTDLTRDRITSNQASLSGGDRLSQDEKMIGVYLMQMTGILADLLTKDQRQPTRPASNSGIVIRWRWSPFGNKHCCSKRENKKWSQDQTRSMRLGPIGYFEKRLFKTYKMIGSFKTRTVMKWLTPKIEQ